MFKLLVVLSAFVAISWAAAAGDYPTKYDNIDVDEILKNERLLSVYTKCLLGKGPCPPDGSELRKYLPDALQTGCSKCTDKQREGARKVIKFLIQKKPDTWRELSQKFDSEGVYFKKYEDQYRIVASS